MAIDTENKRRNVMRIFTPMLLLNLVSADGLDQDDRENVAGGYIGFDYAPVVSVAQRRPKTTLTLGIGFC